MSLLSTLATTVVRTAGLSLVIPIVEEEAIASLQSTDHEVIARKVELPEAEVRALCAKTGADPEKAIAARDAFGEAFATMVLSFSPSQKG